MSKSEYLPKVREIAEGEVIELHTRFGSLSRGRCWGKCYPCETRPCGEWVWVSKSDGVLYLDQPGYYIVGSSDGFSREARGEFALYPQPPLEDGVDGVATPIEQTEKGA